MSDQKKKEDLSSGAEGNEVHKISRQQLLKAGWVVPAVMAINLPTAVQAQTAVPSEADVPTSTAAPSTVAPTAVPTSVPAPMTPTPVPVV